MVGVSGRIRPRRLSTFPVGADSPPSARKPDIGIVNPVSRYRCRANRRSIGRSWEAGKRKIPQAKGKLNTRGEFAAGPGESNEKNPHKNPREDKRRGQGKIQGEIRLSITNRLG
jgi:hypothetical protein